MYTCKEVRIRANNNPNGVAAIVALWADIHSGKIPICADESHFPIAKYSNYESDAEGDYDFSILSVTPDFVDDLYAQARQGIYRKYEYSGEEGFGEIVGKLWSQVYDDSRSGAIQRAYTADYEYSAPAKYTDSGQNYTALFVAVK